MNQSGSADPIQERFLGRQRMVSCICISFNVPHFKNSSAVKDPRILPVQVAQALLLSSMRASSLAARCSNRSKSFWFAPEVLCEQFCVLSGINSWARLCVAWEKPLQYTKFQPIRHILPFQWGQAVGLFEHVEVPALKLEKVADNCWYAS